MLIKGLFLVFQAAREINLLMEHLLERLQESLEEQLHHLLEEDF
jgi:hypothetical protein